MIKAPTMKPCDHASRVSLPGSDGLVCWLAAVSPISTIRVMFESEEAELTSVAKSNLKFRELSRARPGFFYLHDCCI